METGSYIDTHAHIPMLEHVSAETCLKQARAQGIKKIITVSTNEDNWASSRALALAHPDVFYTVGVHPHDAKDWARYEPAMEKFLAENPSPKCVGIGETGLDFHYNFSEREKQIEALASQARIASKLGLPLILHCREAFPDLYATLKKAGLGKRAGVLHCFTGTYEEAKKGLDMGLKVSFSGILTFKTAEELRQVAKRLPDSEIMVETDCPYLAPIPFRGKPNEPALLPHTVKVLAECRGISVEEAGRITSENATKFFALG